MVGSLVPVLLLAGVHLVAARLRRSLGLSEGAVISLAGGISVAYVFLHLLPEVAAGSGPIGASLANLPAPTPTDELAAFTVALLGFVVFYVLEHFSATEGGREEAGAGPFAVHVGAFALYNAAIAYTLPLRVQTDTLGAGLFTFAIGLHVLVVDRGLAAHYPRRFRRVGRYVLAAALLLGWAVALASAPTSRLLASLLTALVAGSVLLTVVKEELPVAQRSRVGWFLAGVLGYAAVLLVIGVWAPLHVLG